MKELAKHLIRQGYLYVGGEKTIEASIKFGKKYKYKPDLEVFDLTKYMNEDNDMDVNNFLTLYPTHETVVDAHDCTGRPIIMHYEYNGIKSKKFSYVQRNR